MSVENWSDEAARLVSLANEVVIENDRAAEAHAVMDFIRASAAAGCDQGARGYPIVAPTQAGKSTILLSYLKKLNTSEALDDRRIPVLLVTLTASQTRKGLAQDILKAIGKFGYETVWKTGTEGILLDRVGAFIRQLKIEILMLDEFQHLVDSDSKARRVNSDRTGIAMSVAETIKWFLIEGIVPVVMSGTDDALRPIKANPQLAMRCEPQLDLSQLESTNAVDLEIFRGFLVKYLVELESRDIVRNATALLQHSLVPDAIFEVCDGYLGRACDLLKAALVVAVRDGRRAIDVGDLETACQRSFSDFDLVTNNPFRNGLKALESARS